MCCSYGNTSSSSIWYEMDYIRKHSELHRGQRVLQVAFGSGFKCNSAVWLCLNNPPVPPHTTKVHQRQRDGQVAATQESASKEGKKEQ